MLQVGGGYTPFQAYAGMLETQVTSFQQLKHPLVSFNWKVSEE